MAREGNEAVMQAVTQGIVPSSIPSRCPHLQAHDVQLACSILDPVAIVAPFQHYESLYHSDGATTSRFPPVRHKRNFRFGYAFDNLRGQIARSWLLELHCGASMTPLVRCCVVMHDAVRRTGKWLGYDIARTSGACHWRLFFSLSHDLQRVTHL